jgi:hypothetical protein
VKTCLCGSALQGRVREYEEAIDELEREKESQIDAARREAVRESLQTHKQVATL